MTNLDKLRYELSVPKNQYNSFGKYNYRSQEDILEAVKPLLKKYDLSLLIKDDIQQIGDRYYVKATVIISGEGELTESTAYAREPLNKKGMDESQITGTASSYARKYALNALLLLDDTKDADTDEHHKQTQKPTTKKFNREDAIKKIDELMQRKGFSLEYREQIKAQYPKAKTHEDFVTIYKAVELDAEAL